MAARWTSLLSPCQKAGRKLGRAAIGAALSLLCCAGWSKAWHPQPCHMVLLQLHASLPTMTFPQACG